jgi:hypothetical protein
LNDESANAFRPRASEEGSVDEIGSFLLPSGYGKPMGSGKQVRGVFEFLCCAFLLSAVHGPASAQSPSADGWHAKTS